MKTNNVVKLRKLKWAYATLFGAQETYSAEQKGWFGHDIKIIIIIICGVCLISATTFMCEGQMRWCVISVNIMVLIVGFAKFV